MESANLVLCELKGIVNSNPDIISSYPELSIKDSKVKDMIHKFLPFGAKIGDFFITNYSKYNILSYIFNLKNSQNRDDLVSISVLIKKRENPEIFKPILKGIIDNLKENNLLKEDILIKNLNVIYESINQEKDIEVDNIKIEISKMFEELKQNLIKSKLKLKGSFY